MLIGKTAIITGASNGIGRAVSLMLASLGADIVINYFSDDAAAKVIACEAGVLGARTAIIKADVGTMDGVHAVYDTAVRQFSKIDILVNNAGVFIENDFLSLSEKDYDRTQEVITKGTFFLTQLIAKNMIANSIKGRIINISSSATFQIKGMPVDYCIAKSGVNIMTKALAEILGKDGITVNAILPGSIPTKINKWQFDDPVIRQSLIDETALKTLGNTEYIAGAVKYLVSDEAKWTTGAFIEVNGGLVF